MPANTSEARIIANRRNALRSTGPKTEAGKARSRANAHKHGLTGAGIALPEQAAQEVELRFLAIQEELTPQTVLGAYFAHQIALMTVRCQRAARQESAAIAVQVRRATVAFDEGRVSEADHLFAWIGSEPVSYHRKLMATPEGTDRLIASLLGLKAELDAPEICWNFNYSQQLDWSFGQKGTHIPRSRGHRLSEAIKGDFSGISAAKVAHLTTESERRNWACDELTVIILAEVARLEAHRATLDHASIALDRTESGTRALFDAGKEATLARKYEAAATRELYRALREFRAVEAIGNPTDPTVLEPPDSANPAETELITTLEADDAVVEATIGPIPERSKPFPLSELEKTAASFAKPFPALSFAAAPALKPTAHRPREGQGQPLGQRPGPG